jgi:hypothetical protein
MNESPPQASPSLYLIAAMGLFVLLLNLFAGVWPFHLDSIDEWGYFYHTQRILEQGDWFYSYADYSRQYIFFGYMVAQWVLPNGYHGLFYSHLAYIYIVALGLFHLGWRSFPRYRWVAFLIAAIYLAYIPANPSWVTPWLSVYSWPMALGVVSLVLLLEYSRQQRWWLGLFFLGLAALCAYASIRILEGTFPPLVVFSGLLLWVGRRSWPALALGIAVMSLGIGLGIAPFLNNFLASEDLSTQESLHSPSNDPLELVTRFSRFHQVSLLTPTRLQETPYDYLGPGLVSAGVVGLVSLLMWLRQPAACQFPSWRFWAWAVPVAVAVVSINGAAYVYAGLVDTGREQTLAAPGHALLLLALLSLLAWGMRSLLAIRLRYSLACLLSVFFIISTQWFYAGQHYLRQELPDYTAFDDQSRFFRQVLAWLPALESDTIILLKDCSHAERLPLYLAASLNSTQAIYIMYHLAQGSGIQMASMDRLYFNLQGLDFLPGKGLTRYGFGQFYGYEQMVVLECRPEGLTLLPYFPNFWAVPAEAATERYQPYARIRPGFIPQENQTFMSR